MTDANVLAVLMLGGVGLLVGGFGLLQEHYNQKQIAREKADGTYAWPVRGAPPASERSTAHSAE